ncbi:MAG: hypothetical protein HKN13_03810 [Rhodothermales bacterium]|nr:hypothetical protein [Rhodothermales bacterium]
MTDSEANGHGPRDIGYVAHVREDSVSVEKEGLPGGSDRRLLRRKSRIGVSWLPVDGDGGSLVTPVPQIVTA